MTESGAAEPVVRHFRQILLWPLSLTPLRASAQVRHHWQVFLSAQGAGCHWAPFEDESNRFEEQHYRELVTFPPHVQRFLYGQARSRSHGHDSARGLRRGPDARVPPQRRQAVAAHPAP